jgi:hypothetical protein
MIGTVVAIVVLLAVGAVLVDGWRWQREQDKPWADPEPWQGGDKEMWES